MILRNPVLWIGLAYHKLVLIVMCFFKDAVENGDFINEDIRCNLSEIKAENRFAKTV